MIFIEIPKLFFMFSSFFSFFHWLNMHLYRNSIKKEFFYHPQYLIYVFFIQWKSIFICCINCSLHDQSLINEIDLTRFVID